MIDRMKQARNSGAAKMTNPGETNRRTTPKSKHRNDQTEGFQSFFGVVGTAITCIGTAREGSIESSRGRGDGRFSIVLIIVLGLLEFSGEESNFRAARARDRELGVAPQQVSDWFRAGIGRQTPNGSCRFKSFCAQGAARRLNR